MAAAFDNILAGREAMLQSLCDERTQETVSLEFKCKEDASNGKFSRNDKRNLGRTLSAFANSEGGTLVWGVACSKEPPNDYVDCARELRPISQIDQFRSEAISLCGEIIRPVHPGLRIEAIESTQQAGGGYLVIDVDRSDRRPHMCRASEDGRYYRRAGSSSFLMEHGDLEDAFSRRRVANLDICCEWRLANGLSRSGAQIAYQVLLIIGLRNEGLVSARFPYLYLSTKMKMSHGDPSLASDRLGLDGNRTFGLPPAMPVDGWERYVGGSDSVVHPNDILWVAQYAVGMIAYPGQMPITVHHHQTASRVQLEIAFKVGCLDGRMAEGNRQLVLSDAPRPG